LKILIIDNYDSFTYNLYHYVRQFCEDVTVLKNDEIIISNLSVYSKIILSPGPGLPEEHENLLQIISNYHISTPILGICLGHQAICQFFGGKLVNLKNVKHGVSAQIEHYHNDIIFKDISNNINVGLYHSWFVEESSFPSVLDITSRSEFGYITSFKHKKYNIKGVQFHPESILTNYGLKIIENWLND